ncbi:MAG: phosphodiesterase [Clostridiaceae bacterium]|nr:phosphodiesterase [Clostridiaceae bacterium]
MKWFIASDIHGSAYCCKMMLERYKEEKADRLLLLGDILYHGPRNDLPLCYAPKEVIAMLSEKGSETLSVRGNCDCEVDQMVLPFPVLADYTVLDTGSRLIFATHGHLFSPSRPLPMKKGDILLSGHTHVPRCEETDGLVFLNPGSVSIPKEGSVRSYMTLENGVFLWKELESSKTYKEYSL